MTGRAESSGSQSPQLVTWRDVVDTLFRHKFLFLVVFAVTVASAAAIAFVMTPVYRSEVLLVPSKDRQSGSGIGGQLGSLRGLAGVAGISLPTGEGGDSEISIEVLKSRGFLAKFIETNQLLPELFAGQWDSGKSEWKPGQKSTPTIDDGVQVFRERVLKVRPNGPGGTIRLAVEWRDREKAAQWANGLVLQLNDRLRQRAIDDATNSLEYLQRSLQDTSVSETRQSISRLIEEQLNKLTLANIRQDFAFEVLDPAVPGDAHRPLRPQKALYMALGGLAGLALAAMAVAMASGLRRRPRP